MLSRMSLGDTVGRFSYLSDDTERSITSTGRVGTRRDATGSDGGTFGIKGNTTVELPVLNARPLNTSLDVEGVRLVSHRWEHIDYYDEVSVLKSYYPECCELVRRQTGGSRVIAFDHNIRNREKSRAGVTLNGGNKVQVPASGVHADYTVTSAPNRIRNLAKPLGINDTLRGVYGDGPVLDAEQVEEMLLKKRFVFINVWRSITDAPVCKTPLAICDATSVPLEDIVTFEVQYADRIGENYLAGHSAAHRWLYFPKMVKDEVLLIKCWDSRGQDFAGHPCHEHHHSAHRRSTFCFHSAFEDPADPESAPGRESIEVRTIVFFDDDHDDDHDDAGRARL